MTSYIAIANSEVDPNSPITADLLTKLRDNPIAIGEGAVGAPRIVAAGLNSSISSLSGSVGGSSSLQVTLGSYSFFPAVDSAAATSWGNSTNADAPKLLLTNSGGSAASYTITWRHLN